MIPGVKGELNSRLSFSSADVMPGATHAAHVRSRQFGDPALLVRTLASLLPIVGDDTVLQEARSAAGQVRAALASDARQAFEGSELGWNSFALTVAGASPCCGGTRCQRVFLGVDQGHCDRLRLLTHANAQGIIGSPTSVATSLAADDFRPPRGASRGRSCPRTSLLRSRYRKPSEIDHLRAARSCGKRTSFRHFRGKIGGAARI
jgi:hypothetical protein